MCRFTAWTSIYAAVLLPLVCSLEAYSSSQYIIYRCGLQSSSMQLPHLTDGDVKLSQSQAVSYIGTGKISTAWKDLAKGATLGTRI